MGTDSVVGASEAALGHGMITQIRVYRKLNQRHETGRNHDQERRGSGILLADNKWLIEYRALITERAYGFHYAASGDPLCVFVSACALTDHYSHTICITDTVGYALYVV